MESSAFEELETPARSGTKYPRVETIGLSVFVRCEITTDPAREFGSSESDHWNLFDFQALTSLFVVFFYVANPDFFPVGYLQSLLSS